MTIVVSRGSITGLSTPVSGVSRAIELLSGESASYEAIWRTQPQVRTVVSFLARNVAQLGIHVYRRVSDTDRQRMNDHPLATLLRTPNHRTTRYRLIESLVSDLAIFDNAFWLKVKTTSGPNLVRLPPQFVEPDGDNWMWADRFKLVGSKGTAVFQAEQVVHFRGHNPGDTRWGCSALESLRRILAEESAAAEYREQLWQSGARLSGVIKRPATAPPWSDGARLRFSQGWRSMFAGDGPNVGGTAILEDGMEFQEMGMSARDAQYIEARKLTREEVAAAYHIPLPMVGILDHATFSNITEQHKQLYQDTLGPWLEMIQEEIELQLLPDLDMSGNVYVEFNLAEKLKGSFEEQAAAFQASVGRPWMTADEARARVNLPSLGGEAAQLITPLNVAVDGGEPPMVEE